MLIKLCLCRFKLIKQIVALHGCVNNKICNTEICKIIKNKIAAKIQFLDVIFDNKLRWTFHINNLLGKLHFNTFKLVKLKNMVPKQTMKSLFYTKSIKFSVWSIGMGWPPT